ncbi:hypothetical protein AAVH_08407 [Aphelenchoides avenae]|nr:hypothetical protein AAVH_08407 [Aphelenchus avenae]
MRCLALLIFPNFGLEKNIMQEKRELLEPSRSYVAHDVKHDIASGIKRRDGAVHIDVTIGSVVSALDRRSEFFYLKRKVAVYIRCFRRPLMMTINNFRYASLIGRIQRVKDAECPPQSYERRLY